MNKKIITSVLLFIIFLITVHFAAAAENTGALGAFGDAFRALFGTYNVGEFYEANANWVDFIVLLVLFIGLSEFALGRHFNTRGGKVMVAALGVILAIAGTWWLYTKDQNLGALGPLALVIVFGFVAFILFWGITRIAGEEHKFTGMAIAYIVVYFGLKAQAPEITTFLEGVPFAGPLLPLLSAIAMLYLAVQIVRLIGKLFGGVSIPSAPGFGAGAGRGLGALGAGLGKLVGGLNRQESALDVAEEKQAIQVDKKAQRSISDLQRIRNKLKEVRADISKGDIKELQKDYANMLPSVADLDRSTSEIVGRTRQLWSLQRSELTRMQQELNVLKSRIPNAKHPQTRQRLQRLFQEVEKERLMVRKEIGRAQGLMFSERTLMNHINLLKAHVRQGRNALVAKNKAAASAAFNNALAAIETVISAEKNIRTTAQALKAFQRFQRKQNKFEEEIAKKIPVQGKTPVQGKFPGF